MMRAAASDPTTTGPLRPMLALPTTRPAQPYLSPECRVGEDQPDFEQGCAACQYPGYRSPVLGWVPVKCGHRCHEPR